MHRNCVPRSPGFRRHPSERPPGYQQLRHRSPYPFYSCCCQPYSDVHTAFFRVPNHQNCNCLLKIYLPPDTLQAPARAKAKRLNRSAGSARTRLFPVSAMKSSPAYGEACSSDACHFQSCRLFVNMVFLKMQSDIADDKFVKTD